MDLWYHSAQYIHPMANNDHRETRIRSTPTNNTSVYRILHQRDEEIYNLDYISTYPGTSSLVLSEKRDDQNYNNELF